MHVKDDLAERRSGAGVLPQLFRLRQAAVVLRAHQPVGRRVQDQAALMIPAPLLPYGPAKTTRRVKNGVAGRGARAKVEVAEALMLADRGV